METFKIQEKDANLQAVSQKSENKYGFSDRNPGGQT